MYCFCDIIEVLVVRLVCNEYDWNGKGMVKEIVEVLDDFNEYLLFLINRYY